MTHTDWPGLTFATSRRAISAVTPEMAVAAACSKLRRPGLATELVFAGAGELGEGARRRAEHRVADL
jgi:hypothetical protein